MRAHYLRSYLRGHFVPGHDTRTGKHTHTYSPTIAIRRGAKCGVGVASAGVAAATANSTHLPPYSPLLLLTSLPLFPHNDIIIISGCRFTLSSAHRRENIAASLALTGASLASAHAHSQLLSLVCACMCGIIPPEFAANPLKFATANKKKKETRTRTTRSCTLGVREGGREGEWGRGWQAVVRQVQFCAGTGLPQFMYSHVWVCVGSLSASLSLSLALHDALSGLFVFVVCVFCFGHTHTHHQSN